MQFAYTNNDNGDHSDKEHERSQQSEEVHRLHSEFGKEPKRNQIQISVEETVESEFGRTIFTCLVVYHLLTYLLESGILCQIGDITMHFAIHFDVFHDIFAVGFQAAVEVVQIWNA